MQDTRCVKARLSWHGIYFASALSFVNLIFYQRPHCLPQIAMKTPDMKLGDILKEWGDCPGFERDVRVWCQRLEHLFLCNPVTL